MPRAHSLPQHKRPNIPTSHFIHSATDELALDCKRLEAMWRTPRLAHRQSYYSLYWVTEGKATTAIDFVDYALGPATLVLLQPGQVFYYPRITVPLQGQALFFARDFLALESLGAANPFPVLAGANLSARAPIVIDRENYTAIDQIVRTIASEFAGDEPGRDVMVRATLSTLLVTLGRLRPVATTAFYPSIVRTFLGLVERHFAEYPRTNQYAHMLGVTPGHLSETTKIATGQTASAVVHERILLEAKRLLFQTDASIAEIAASLAFADASYFARFFHRATGVTPKAFRQSIREKSQATPEKSLDAS